MDRQSLRQDRTVGRIRCQQECFSCVALVSSLVFCTVVCLPLLLSSAAAPVLASCFQFVVLSVPLLSRFTGLRGHLEAPKVTKIVVALRIGFQRCSGRYFLRFWTVWEVILEAIVATFLSNIGLIVG